MFSKDLELTIGQCYKDAREQRHEFMTVEHLLLALLENPSAAAVLRACGNAQHALALERGHRHLCAEEGLFERDRQVSLEIRSTAGVKSLRMLSAASPRR